ncbi:MAG: NAD(P)/FAD-dependent oxidoreductase [Deltaproteobacteria bacterium]|nr:NAD(P)/FAD-dependent oxidoreductase [Deltaproteobacteria bacterium]
MHQILPETWDVIVVGSGLGGLSAGALLARQGFRVLVLERRSRIGGRCSTLDVRGYRCTTGVIGPETGGVLQGLFERLGAPFDVRPAGPPHYRIRGRVCAMPEKGGLGALLEAACDNAEERARVLKAVSAALKGPLPRGEETLRDWLLHHTADEVILGVFQAMVSAATLVNAHEISARAFFLFLRKMRGVRDFGFCPRGSVSLAQALAEVISGEGGRVMTGARVRRIVVEGGQAQGVVVEIDGTGGTLTAPVVVSNCGPRGTLELTGRGVLGEVYERQVDEVLKPAAVIALHVGADRPLLRHKYLIVTGARRVNAVFQPTSICPELAPAGRHYLLAGAAPLHSEGPIQARAEIDLCLEDLREILPGFQEHAEVLFAAVYRGAWPGMHAWPGRDMPVETPVRGLYNVGDGVKARGMVAAPAAAESGMLAAERITAEFFPQGS